MTVKAPVLLNEKQRTKSFGFVQQVMEEKRIERVAAEAKKANYADAHLEGVKTSDLGHIKSSLQKGMLKSLFTLNASGVKQNLQGLKNVNAHAQSRKGPAAATI